MIVIVSNRSVNENASDYEVFGEEVNSKGPNELRIATATRDGGQWRVDLLPESDNLENNPPSRQLFKKVISSMINGSIGKEWIFYIHGFNQSFEKSLNACHDLHEQYGVNIIIFSWPSNPGGFVTDEYKKAKQAARSSSGALDRCFELLVTYILETASSKDLKERQARTLGVSINLLVHSLGNYLMESYIRNPIYTEETQVFDNIVFHQADVDHETHSEWINKVKTGKRIYVTLNQLDDVLKASSLINPRRLGNTPVNLNASNVFYIDFSFGDEVSIKHNLFSDGAKDNSVIKNFFSDVFQGHPGEEVVGLTYNESANAFRLDTRKSPLQRKRENKPDR